MCNMLMNPIIKSTILVASLVITTNALSSSWEDKVVEQVKPIGNTCMADDKTCASTNALNSNKKARTPEDIYNSGCMACHGTGVNGAPKFGSKEQWAAHISKGKDTLYDHAIHGFNAMPAKGLCSDCSDDEIKSVVDYIVNAAK